MGIEAVLSTSAPSGQVAEATARASVVTGSGSRILVALKCPAMRRTEASEIAALRIAARSRTQDATSA
jgi:hypothetical protein